jgi:Glycosyltransferase family 9 (heptosyltransferase)
MKIDLDSSRYYRGLGDIVMLSWLAEGARTSDKPLTFHRTKDVDLLRLLGMECADDPGGLILDPVFQTEVSDGGRRSRIDYIREFLELTSPPSRPRLRIDTEDQLWADDVLESLGPSVVLLFPQSLWKTREWPPNYWVDLAWKLKEHGVATLTLMQGDDPRFHNVPHFRWNTSFSRLAALMRRARLVIGNDSFPAHLAGTVGTSTLALMGPTRSTVFDHMDSVQCMTSTLDCTGCHFKTPFRAACDQGCMSLYRIFPDEVLRRTLERLRSPIEISPPRI